MNFTEENLVSIYANINIQLENAGDELIPMLHLMRHFFEFVSNYKNSGTGRITRSKEEWISKFFEQAVILRGLINVNQFCANGMRTREQIRNFSEQWIIQINTGIINQNNFVWLADEELAILDTQ